MLGETLAHRPLRSGKGYRNPKVYSRKKGHYLFMEP